jgi:hypothetical protein
MKILPRFPLLAKVLSWLILHLVILGLAFLLFVRWQLGLGLDSLLSGSAGERLGAFGDAVVAKVIDLPPHRWNEEIKSLADDKKVTAAVLFPHGESDFSKPIPPEVLERARLVTPPQPAAPVPAADVVSCRLISNHPMARRLPAGSLRSMAIRRLPFSSQKADPLFSCGTITATATGPEYYFISHLLEICPADRSCFSCVRTASMDPACSSISNPGSGEASRSFFLALPSGLPSCGASPATSAV